MRAITICQPYAELILRLEKRVENREWRTNYRGPLVIHAGKSREWFDSDDQLVKDLGSMPPFGAIVGVADVVDCINIATISAGMWDDKYPWLSKHPHANGTWCWILDNVRHTKVVPYRGAQGLFDIPDAMVRVLSTIAATPKQVPLPPPGCLCREYCGDALKIEDYCPVHSPEEFRNPLSRFL